MSQSPITVTYSLEEVLKQINQKLDNLDAKFTTKIDKLQEDVTEINVRVAKVETKLEAVESDVKELKSTQKNQIWSLIALSFTAVLGLSGAIATVVVKLFFSNVNP